MEEINNAIIKAMGNKKVTEQAMKQAKEKVDTLRKKAEKQRKATDRQRLRAWRIADKKKRHRPKELAPLRRQLATGSMGVQGDRPLHGFTMIGYPKGSVPLATSERKDMAKKRPKERTASGEDSLAQTTTKRRVPKAGTMKDIVTFILSDSPAAWTLASDLQHSRTTVTVHDGRKASPDTCVYKAIVGTMELARVGPNTWSEIIANDFECSPSRVSLFGGR